MGRLPGASKFIDHLRPYTKIADPGSLKRVFTRLQSLSREEQQEQLRELAAGGGPISAAYIARRLYGCSLKEALKTVGRAG